MMTLDLVLNFAPIEFDDAEINIGVLPYQDNKQLDKLRETFKNHLFKRQDDQILAISLLGWIPEVGALQQIRLETNLSLVRDLIQHSLLNYLSKKGATIFKGWPDSILFSDSGSKHDLLQNLPTLPLNSPAWLAVKPLYELEPKRIFLTNGQPLVGLFMDLRSTHLIEKNCQELIIEGIDLSNLHVGERIARNDQRVQAKFSYVGRVKHFNQQDLELYDFRPGYQSVVASGAYLETRIEEFSRCLAHYYKEDTSRVKVELEKGLAQLRFGPERLRRLTRCLQELANNYLELLPGIPYKVANFLTSQNSQQFPPLYTAPKPTFILSRGFTHSWNDKGLTL